MDGSTTLAAALMLIVVATCWVLVQGRVSRKSAPLLGSFRLSFASGYDKKKRAEEERREQRARDAEKRRRLDVMALEKLVDALAPLRPQLEKDGFFIETTTWYFGQYGWTGGTSLRLMGVLGHVRGLLWPRVVWSASRRLYVYMSVGNTFIIEGNEEKDRYSVLQENGDTSDEVFVTYDVQKAVDYIENEAARYASSASASRDEELRRLQGSVLVGRARTLVITGVIGWLYLAWRSPG